LENPVRKLIPLLLVTLASSFAVVATIPQAGAGQPVKIESRFKAVNGVRLHRHFAGTGDPVLLLHGYAQTSHMWLPPIPTLARTHTVSSPDLRGLGGSSKPQTGYDKKTMAQDIHALAEALGFIRVAVVGHDIGPIVAYAYAAQYLEDVDRIVLLDAFVLGVGDWTKV
jgi:pimeloyl-ACP methyl ester carboxylesterase